jgi:hypothetical protein
VAWERFENERKHTSISKKGFQHETKGKAPKWKAEFESGITSEEEQYVDGKNDKSKCKLRIRRRFGRRETDGDA